MNHFLQKIEAALLPTADQYAPEGSDPKAIVHQWNMRSQAETNRLRQNIRPILVELPPKELMTAFTEKVAPRREVVERACREIDRSTSSFLPKLEPGEAAIIGADFPIIAAYHPNLSPIGTPGI